MIDWRLAAAWAVVIAGLVVVWAVLALAALGVYLLVT